MYNMVCVCSACMLHWVQIQGVLAMNLAPLTAPTNSFLSWRLANGEETERKRKTRIGAHYVHMNAFSTDDAIILQMENPLAGAKI